MSRYDTDLKAPVAELADAADSKSVVQKTWEFDPPRGHQGKVKVFYIFNPLHFSGNYLKTSLISFPVDDNLMTFCKKSDIISLKAAGGEHA